MAKAKAKVKRSKSHLDMLVAQHLRELRAIRFIVDSDDEHDAHVEGGDPYPFDREPGAQACRTDFAMIPGCLTECRAWVQKLRVPGRPTIWQLIVVDSDGRRFVTIRSAKTKAQIQRFCKLLNIGYHPNDLPRHIH